MGAIDASYVWQNEAQLWLKRPRMEMVDPVTSAVPPTSSATSTSTSSSLAAGVTLEAIMKQLQFMDARLDSFTNELCQVNTRVSRIAWQQAHLGGFAAWPSPFPEASADEDGDDEDDASSSSDDEMTTTQWLTLCHLWQKGGVVLGWE